MLKGMLPALQVLDIEPLNLGHTVAVIFMGFLIMMVAVRTSRKYHKKFNKRYTYRRQISSPYSRQTGRQDDIDLPSGFIGPMGYKVVRAEDVEGHDKKPADGD
ncbi:MAG: hypothetical protein FWG94_02070 [Oscillospiraceae bacterium]|nr:hypothetical protein [Oscillospiraceae bacterium]